MAELVFSKVSRRPVRWVLAVPQDSPIRGPKDLQDKHLATEVVNLTTDYLERHGVQAHVEFSWGATEVKPPRLADAIVEVTETGSSLRANNLRIVDTILESTPRLIANQASWRDGWKRKKIENITLMLRGAIAAEGKVGLMINVPVAEKDRVLAVLPALQRPHRVLAGRRRLGRGQHGDRRIGGARSHPAAEGRRRQRHRRVPAEQDHRLSGGRGGGPASARVPGVV